MHDQVTRDALALRARLLLAQINALSEVERTQRRDAANATFAEKSRACEQAFARSQSQIVAELNEGIRTAKEQGSGSRAVLQQKLGDRRTDAKRQVGQLIAALGAAARPWNAPQWHHHTPNSNGPIPAEFRIGELSNASTLASMSIPALVNLGAGHNLVFHSSGRAADTCANVVCSVLLRLLAAYPPGLLYLHLLDPRGAGANYRCLDAGSLSCTGKQVFWDYKGIEGELQRVLQQRADAEARLGHYADITSYNASVEGHRLAYHCVAALDFPAGYSQSAADSLMRVMGFDAKPGIFTILHIDQSERVSTSLNWRLIGSATSRTDIYVKSPVSADWDCGGCERTVMLDSLPDVLVQNRVTSQCQLAIKDEKRSVTSYGAIAIPEAEWGRGDSSQSVRVPVGKFDTGDTVEFELGLESDDMEGSSYHALIGGQTGFGKSNLLRVLITQILCKYPQEEIELYLFDFRHGTDLYNYAKYHPNQVKAAVMTASPQAGLSFLEFLNAEMERRATLFMDEAKGAVKFDVYRERTGKRLPRVVAILDEFHLLLESHVRTDAQRLLSNLLRQGRSYGVNVILSTQTLSGLTEMKPAFNQINLCIAFHVNTEEESERILGSQNYGAKDLVDKGAAIFKTALGRVARIAFLNEGDQKTILEKLVAKFGQTNTRILGLKSDLKVFDDQVFIQFADMTKTSVHGYETSLFLGTSGDIKRGPTGELTGTTVAKLSSQLASNLLIVGGDEAQAHRILQSSIISLGASHGRNCRAYVFAPNRDLVALRALIGETIPQVQLISETQLEETLRNINAELERRKGALELQSAPIFIVLAGTGRISALQVAPGGKESTKSPYSGPNTVGSAFLGKARGVLESGPLSRIHSVVWAEQPSELKDVIGPRALDHFAMRIALKGLPAERVGEILGVVLPKVDPRYAQYRELRGETHLEGFQPYLLLERDQIERFFR